MDVSDVLNGYCSEEYYKEFIHKDEQYLRNTLLKSKESPLSDYDLGAVKYLLKKYELEHNDEIEELACEYCGAKQTQKVISAVYRKKRETKEAPDFVTVEPEYASKRSLKPKETDVDNTNISQSNPGASLNYMAVVEYHVIWRGKIKGHEINEFSYAVEPTKKGKEKLKEKAQKKIWGTKRRFYKLRDVEKVIENYHDKTMTKVNYINLCSVCRSVIESSAAKKEGLLKEVEKGLVKITPRI